MSGERLTVEILAEAKGISVEELTEFGVLPTSTGVAISYGPNARTRLRTAVLAGSGSRWDTSKRPIVPYGVHLDQTATARDPETLLLAEGESDCWTAWRHDYRALGIPGASMANVLELDHLAGADRIYAIEEPDDGGRAFIDGLANRLGELRQEHVDTHGNDGGFPTLCRVRLPDGVKDLNELHLRLLDDPEMFREGLDRCIEAAERIDLPEPLIALDALFAEGPSQWPVLDLAALQGLAGDVVRTLEPHTEADSAALLFDLLSSFGNLVGGGPWANGGGERHGAKLNSLIVGNTSRGRKGTARAVIRGLLTEVDEEWSTNGVIGGTASGEGIVRAAKEADGRPLLIVESEFSRVLKVAGRDGSVVSEIIRQSFDGSSLQIIRSKEPIRVTGAHITFIGHITAEELRRVLDDTDIFNGFLNRFPIVAVRRSKKLPSGGDVPWSDRTRLVDRLRAAAETARTITEMTRSPKAEEVWAEWYMSLPDDEIGIVAAATARAEALVLRLSMIYALLDSSATIEADHVSAAIASENYCEDSARWLFGDKLGDPDAEKLIEALIREPDGLTATQESEVYSRHRTRQQLDDIEERADRWLQRRGLTLTRTRRSTNGRPVTVTRASQLPTQAGSEQSEPGDQTRQEKHS
jgi:hypothetical protein